MKKLIIAAIALSALSGCAIPTNTPTVIHLQTPFDAESARLQVEPGNGQISGTAFMKQRGGGVVTCAGNKVFLIPSTEYTKERLNHIYPSTPTSSATSMRPVYALMNQKQEFLPDPPEYSSLIKETTCDAQGNFEFSEVKDGEYFIVTSVFWRVRTNQGGSLSKRVTVSSGKAPRVILSP